MSNRKPREFWIQLGYEDIVMSDSNGWVPGFEKEKAIHVIEFTAYEDLKNKLTIYSDLNCPCTAIAKGAIVANQDDSPDTKK